MCTIIKYKISLNFNKLNLTNIKITVNKYKKPKGNYYY